MNERRRQLIQATAIALAAGLAGCADQPGGGGDDDEENDGDDGGDTGGYGGGGGDETDDGTDTETEAESETQTETETETATETDGNGLSGSSLVIDSVGVEAWEVLEDETGSVAPTGEENPTLTFEVGQRYAVENRGIPAHPFALRAADDSPLLSQSAEGSYEDDADVDWVDNDETFAFTLTEALAADIDYYICTAHPSMRGDVETA